MCSTSNLVLLTELAGRTFAAELRFSDEKSMIGDGAEEDMGFGDKATLATLPSGPYFLGLPLFFFTGIIAAAGRITGWVVAGAGTTAG